MFTKKWIAALAGAMMISSALAGCSSGDKASLKVISEKKVELGDPVSLNPADYLLEDSSNVSSDDIEVSSDLMDDPAYEYNGFSRTVKTKGKDFLEAGTYTITLDYKGKQYPVRVVVEDTVMPEFISPAAVVTIPVGTKTFDFSRIYRTDDKDDVTLSVEGDYDLDTVGTYPVTLVAKDGSGNTNSLEITINVVGGSQPIKAVDQFDNELVPPSDSTQDDPVQQPEPQPSDSTSEPQPSDSTTQAPEEPPKACSISKAPPGTQVFYSFPDLYAAGTAWNQQNPNNYFYYLEGTDDCGTKVYFLTTGSSENPTGQAAGEKAEADTQPE